MISLRADNDRLRRAIRKREAEAVFRHVPDDSFQEALVLGAGDGWQSTLVARVAKMVLSTDLNAERIEARHHPRVTNDVCDAEDIPYETGRFGLIYSSNLLEHLSIPSKALEDMRRVLADDGVMVHVVPNRFWKALQFALFVPNQLLSVMEILLSSERRRKLGKSEAPRNNLKANQPSFLRRNLWPAVHGSYPSNLSEFARMGASSWKRSFAEAGFELVCQVRGLPVHSPYRFGLHLPRKGLERLGLSSCDGYVLKKAGAVTGAAGLFLPDGANRPSDREARV